MKTLKEITGDSLEQMIDYKVVDQNGDSVGTLHSLWSDPTTGTVEFLGVKTGWIFGQNHVVPAEKAELDETQNVVRLPYTSVFVKEAPSMSAEAEISEEEEENIYRYYGLGRGGAPDTSTMSAPEDVSTGMDKLPEASGASAMVTASGRDEGSSNFGAPITGVTGDAAGASRLRRTVRTETAGTQEDQSRVMNPQTQTPTAGQAVRGALDSLVPGDSSSTSTISRSAATPGSYGTTNLYGSTGTQTPVASDSTGTAFEDAGTTTPGGLTAARDNNPDEVVGAANPDVVTGEPGSHPVGTGLGGFSGGAAGAAIGAAVGGPVGAVVGGVVGAVGGGFAGKGIAESINPTEENAYWENNYRSASYYEGDYGYDDYSPAYRAGYEGFSRHAAAGKDYTDVESDLERDYNQNRGSSRLEWDKAKSATRDAWDRLKHRFADETR